MEKIVMSDVDGRCFYVTNDELVSVIEELYEVSPPDAVTLEEFVEWLISL